jgi:hypothetical protein
MPPPELLQRLLRVSWIGSDTMLVHVLQYLGGDFIQHFLAQSINTLVQESEQNSDEIQCKN